MSMTWFSAINLLDDDENDLKWPWTATSTYTARTVRLSKLNSQHAKQQSVLCGARATGVCVYPLTREFAEKAKRYV